MRPWSLSGPAALGQREAARGVALRLYERIVRDTTNLYKGHKNIGRTLLSCQLHLAWKWTKRFQVIGSGKMDSCLKKTRQRYLRANFLPQ